MSNPAPTDNYPAQAPLCWDGWGLVEVLEPPQNQGGSLDLARVLGRYVGSGPMPADRDGDSEPAPEGVACYWFWLYSLTPLTDAAREMLAIPVDIRSVW